MSSIPLGQPLEQTTLGLIINLLLAPIGGLLAAYFPIFLVMLLLSTKLDSALAMAKMMYLVFLGACGVYVIFLFLPLLICFLVLRYFRLFNILSICVVGVLSHIRFAYFTGIENLSTAALIGLSFFSIPTIGFFLFLSIRSHGIFCRKQLKISPKPFAR
jgi:hypothetical protein